MEIWGARWDGKFFNEPALKNMFEDYDKLTKVSRAFSEIESGRQIPELH